VTPEGSPEILAVVDAVGVATVQDGGRPGRAAVGVPVSGALHRARYRTATALVRGSADDHVPAIELLAGDLVLRTTHEVVLAVVGPTRLRIGGHRAAQGTVLLAPAGSAVEVAVVGPGPAYVIIDGWAPTMTLGSAATDTFSRLGGAVLRRGDALTGRRGDGRERVGAFHRLPPDESGPIRVVPTDNPEFPAFVGQRWVVSSTARSGARLTGGRLGGSASIPSMPMVVGAIQQTPSGEAIVLGPDGGLTGGYPVVGVVATVDLDRLSLLQAGQSVAFRSIDVAQAAQAYAACVRALERSMAHPAHLH
jgi:allophanate hydrolase subunit 2